MGLEIKDDFLPRDEWTVIKDALCGDNFPWYWTDEVLNKDREDLHPILCEKEYNFQFFHEMYSNNHVNSQQLYILSPILNALNIRALVRVKANLNTRTEQIVRHGMHTDYDYDCTTAIYYVNSNDGYTEFESGEKVQSIENRLVIFPTQTLHSGTTCTDTKKRVIVNFNYF
tara:strand:+ start:60 stop:572 length:513 start_codon:yes stop_codon:yes gene_type:complete